MSILKRVKASPRAVWQALISAQARERWLSADFTVTQDDANDCAAGHYRVTLASVSGHTATFEVTPAGDGAEVLVAYSEAAEAREWKTRVRRLVRHVEER